MSTLVSSYRSFACIHLTVKTLSKNIFTRTYSLHWSYRMRQRLPFDLKPALYRALSLRSSLISLTKSNQKFEFFFFWPLRLPINFSQPNFDTIESCCCRSGCNKESRLMNGSSIRSQNEHYLCRWYLSFILMPSMHFLNFFILPQIWCDCQLPMKGSFWRVLVSIV